MIVMNRETKIAALALYKRAAMNMAYSKGATKENIVEVAGKMRMIDIAEYIKQNAERK